MHGAPSTRAVPRVVVIVFLAALIGGGAGLLSFADQGSVPQAVLTGSGAFAAAVALFIALLQYAGDTRR
ncbi:hypothetical protein [Symbioplanes lichenis]|uniref:hypothetical protein n=1 Tax=Symbioplanes lichenis TaxID=1629072 RepID=UPI002739218F|nr:hypothetical protein [Actinoplanes lichenis]